MTNGGSFRYLRASGSNLPRSTRSSPPTPTLTTSAASWMRRNDSFSAMPATSSRKRSGTSGTRTMPGRKCRSSWSISEVRSLTTGLSS